MTCVDHYLGCQKGDDSKAADRITGIGSQRDIEFSDILFTTNVHIPILLPFFRNENLRYMIVSAHYEVEPAFGGDEKFYASQWK